MKRQQWFALSVAALALMGCRANEDSIEQFINTAHLEAKANVEPLDAQPVFVAEEFVMTSPRVPFLQPRPELAQQARNAACWQPELRSKRTPLEAYPLEQLSMRGVMGQGSSLWALIYTPAGKLVKVREGHYLGVNQGRILKVLPKSVEVEEVLPDGEGCWLKRPIKLTLAKQVKPTS
ncbi:pilus assembly protein PilQ [Photobacterium aquae]|uniref:Pilus assembly protein PilQ n=1 Tax=Photobacterium aquae TaxID=1195763 RepID=A0A0J1H724_9GAMM|nr:pilus assembly protein PilP [Photobacterium aquae]KLV07496.1 pilus assembly protein PilQ [Photobacterium aquae]